MGYDPAVVFRRVRDILSRTPGRSLSSVAAELDLDRHTLTRHLRKAASLEFNELRLEFVAMALDRLTQRHRPLLRKEVANELGFRSTRTLGQWIWRVTNRTDIAALAPESTEKLHPKKRRRK